MAYGWLVYVIRESFLGSLIRVRSRFAGVNRCPVSECEDTPWPAGIRLTRACLFYFNLTLDDYNNCHSFVRDDNFRVIGAHGTGHEPVGVLT